MLKMVLKNKVLLQYKSSPPKVLRSSWRGRYHVPERYLVLVLDERPQLSLALATGFLLGLLDIGEAGVGRRPLHGLAVVLKLHVTGGLETRLVRLHNLF